MDTLETELDKMYNASDADIEEQGMTREQWKANINKAKDIAKKVGNTYNKVMSDISIPENLKLGYTKALMSLSQHEAVQQDIKEKRCSWCRWIR